MSSVLRFSALFLGMLTVWSQADARGGEGFGIGLSGGFRGFSGHAGRLSPSFHSMTEFHHHSFVRRPLSSARRFPHLGLNQRRLFPGTGAFIVGSDLSSDGLAGDIETTANAPVPVQPEVIIIRSGGQGRTEMEPAPDYSYAGCQAIPNGYHCDIGVNSAR